MAQLNLGSSLILVTFSLFVFAEGCAPQSVSSPKSRPKGIYHRVRGGENLFRIGKAYDIPYRNLAYINRIQIPSHIRVGQRIFIPGGKRQLPVEIITPSKVSLARPKVDRRKRSGRRRFIWPVSGTLTSRFGKRGNNFHDGIDIAAKEGTSIRAIEKGVVLYKDRLRGYGNIIIIRHADRFASVYAHNRKNLVKKGQRVARGQVIGQVGRTGRVTGPHLHFEIRRRNIARNPLYYLPRTNKRYGRK